MKLYPKKLLQTIFHLYLLQTILDSFYKLQKTQIMRLVHSSTLFEYKKSVTSVTPLFMFDFLFNASNFLYTMFLFFIFVLILSNYLKLAES